MLNKQPSDWYKLGKFNSQWKPQLPSGPNTNINFTSEFSPYGQATGKNQMLKFLFEQGTKIDGFSYRI